MLSVALSKLYKVDYAQIIDNAAGSHIAKENIYLYVGVMLVENLLYGKNV